MALNVSENMVFQQFQICKEIYTSGMLNKVDLKPTSKLVLIALANHYNHNRPDMFPSQVFLATQLGIDVKSVNRAVKELFDKGLIAYETKKVNRYKFTSIFFGMVKMSIDHGQKVHEDITKKSMKQIKEHENNNLISFNKKMPYRHNTQQEGVNYPSPEQSKEAMSKVLTRDELNPRNDKEIAWKYVQSLQNQVSNPIIKKKVDEICEIWGFDLNYPEIPDSSKNHSKSGCFQNGKDHFVDVNKTMKISYSSQF